MNRIKRKKGVQNEENYSQNVIKKQRLSASQYTSSRNLVVPAKSIGEDCRCKKKCFMHVPESELLQNFQELHEISTKNEQDIYLQSLISCTELKEEGPEQKLQKVSIDKRVRRLASLKQVGKIPQDGRGKEIGSRMGNYKKIEDIKKVLKHIPSKYVGFYNDIINWKTTTIENVEEDGE